MALLLCLHQAQPGLYIKIQTSLGYREILSQNVFENSEISKIKVIKSNGLHFDILRSLTSTPISYFLLEFYSLINVYYKTTWHVTLIS